MAPVDQDTVGKVCYNSRLYAFDDGLQRDQSSPENTYLGVSDFRESLDNTVPFHIDLLHYQDSWCLPTAKEKDLDHCDRFYHCLWVGWLVPELYLAMRPGSTRKKCVHDCRVKPLNRSVVSKAFKVVYRVGPASGNKLYALHSPDKNGVCVAVAVLNLITDVLFFGEWRDDTVVGCCNRQHSWMQKIAEAAATVFPDSKPDNSFLSQYSSIEAHQESYNDLEADLEAAFIEWESSDFDKSSDSDYIDESHSMLGSGDEAEDYNEGGNEDNGNHGFQNDTMSQSCQVRADSPKMPPVLSRERPVTGISAIKLVEAGPQPKLRKNSTPLSKPKPSNTSLTGFGIKFEKTPMSATRSSSKVDKGQKRQLRTTLAKTRPKRTRLAHQSETTAPKIEGDQLGNKVQVKAETVDESDDEIQFVREIPCRNGQDNTGIGSTSHSVSVGESVAFIIDFVTAGKVTKLARLPDAFSRRATLKTFRTHLKSTAMAQFDALAENITEIDDEDTRIMVAETLVERLNERMAGVVEAPSFESQRDKPPLGF